MKRVFAFVCCLILTFSAVAQVSAADSIDDQQEVLYFKTEDLGNGITVTTEITVAPTSSRATDKSATCSQTYTKNDTVIAVITIQGTFRYDGSTVRVVSKSVTQTTTYNGWSYSQTSFTSSGGTITLTGKLTKLFSLNVPVNLSLTCDKDGNIS